MKTYHLLFTAFCASTLIPFAPLRAGILAGPVINPANGHRYFLLTTNTWTDARDEASTFGADLVIINDAAEQAWVRNTFGNWGGQPRNLWLGLRRLIHGGPFRWVDNTAVSYHNWLPGEPNNDGGLEDYGMIYAYPHLPEGTVGGWNDVPNNGYPSLPQLAQIHGVVEGPAGPITIGCLSVDPCTITLAPGDTRFDGMDITIVVNTRFVIQGEHSFASIQTSDNAVVVFDSTNVTVGTLKSGNYELNPTGVVRAGDIYLTNHSVFTVLGAWDSTNAANGGVGGTIIASNVTIDATSSINGVGKGFPGSYGNWGIGPGTRAGDEGAKTGAASHGGVGLLAGPTYGSALHPTGMGSSGSGVYVDGWFAGTGGSGGSAVHLQISGALVLDGAIAMDGVNGDGKAGGGAGGSIWLESGTFSGNGSLTACGGGGMNNAGGGRIAVYASGSMDFTGFTNCSVAGGKFEPQTAGQDGTMAFFKTSGGTNQFKLGVPKERWAANPDRQFVLKEIAVGGLPGANALVDLSAITNLQVGAIRLLNGTLQLGDRSLAQVSGNVEITNSSILALGGGAALEVGGILSLQGTNATLVVQGKDVSAQVSHQWVGVGGTIRAGSARIDAGSKLSADSQGYLGTYGDYGRGPGANDRVGGGGHGGYGGANGGQAYGNSLEPITPGSSGGGVYVDGWYAGTGGNGGGAIHLVVTNDLILNGLVTANGGNGGYEKAGGGAGGSIWTEVGGTLTGTGRFSATGGDSSGAKGSGGGGRIAVYSSNLLAFAGITNSTVAAGTVAQAGQDGTLLFSQQFLADAQVKRLFIVPAYRFQFPSHPATADALRIGWPGAVAGAVFELPEDQFVQLGSDLTLANGALFEAGGGSSLAASGTVSLFDSNTVLRAHGKNIYGQVNGLWAGVGFTLAASNLVIQAGAKMDAEGQGYCGGYGWQAIGPGGGSPVSGGSYGGHGAGGGPTYGSAEFPLDLGSSGDGRYVTGWFAGVGGSGGGAVRVALRGTATVDGLITVNGLAGYGNGAAGGGAGGSIWLEAAALQGTGFLTANGGAPNGGGAGGGGRIALHVPQMAGFGPGHITASRGNDSAEDGTIYTTGATPLRVVAQKPGGTIGQFVKAIDLTFSSPLADGTFTTVDLALATPNGPLPTGQFTLTRLGAASWRVGIPQQSANGDYVLSAGPTISNWQGAGMSAAHLGPFTISVPRSLTQTLELDGLALSFPTVPGMTYQLQGSSDLVTWTDLGTPTIGDGNVRTIKLSTTDAPAGFYRLLLASY